MYKISFRIEFHYDAHYATRRAISRRYCFPRAVGDNFERQLARPVASRGRIAADRITRERQSNEPLNEPPRDRAR